MRILIIDDEPNIRKALVLGLETMGYEASSVKNGKEAVEYVEQHGVDVAFLDLNLGSENGLNFIEQLLKAQPDLSIVVLTAHASYTTAVEAIKLGAFDYIPKPITPDVMRQVLLKISKNRILQQRVEDLEKQVAVANNAYDFSDDDPAMTPTIQLLEKVAPTMASVLILGENGTGKSVLASEIHRRSDRCKEPFFTVSCPSLSAELLESELFGHVKGAFTGAIQNKVGKVEAASGGTLFLDEIGELPLSIQSKFLRLLQEREYEQVGDHKTRKADVRIVTATNRNIEAMVALGTFREDLFYRLNVITIHVPPLRERSSSILKLANRHLRQLSSSMGRELTGFSEAAQNLMLSYDWPGNLRELRNALERAVILADGPLIQVWDLPMASSPTTGTSIHVGSLVSMEHIERCHIEKVLQKAKSLDDAAKILGIDAATLYRKRKKYNIE
jgi:two-component system, NtrC family, response regulator AlgB